MKFAERFVISVLMLAGIACTDMGAAIPGNADAAEALWRSFNLTTYSLEERQDCFCLFGGEVFLVSVSNNQIIAVRSKDTGSLLPPDQWHRFRTVDGFFEFIRSLRSRPLAMLKIEYDRHYGYPATIEIDYDEHAVDDEIRYRNENLAVPE
jgi:hypothetical protein